ncbi:MAG: thiolase domain-containing protein [Candidatus Bathyarchaeia archaeon]
MSNKPLASIVSGGLSKFGKLEGRLAREIFLEAIKEAIDNCPNLDPKKDIEAIFVGQMSESYEEQGHIGSVLSDWAGLTPKFATRVESACASSGVALLNGIIAISSGLYKIVLVGGVEKMTNRPTGEVTKYLAEAADFPFEQWNGMTFPGLYALMATAHMNDYGTTEEQLAKVAVKNHKNGAMNPKAHMQKEVSLEEVMNSRVIAWPLKLYDCSLISDGASCIVLTEPSLSKKFTDSPVHIVGVGCATDSIALSERESLTSLKSARLAAQKAYKMAGIKPKDLDLAEVHDCFTIAEIIAYEDLEICKPGMGGKLIEEGITELGGKTPVNTSGGLKAKGHPVGATGAAQAYEVYLQLTGQAGKRQVSKAEVGLTHNVGGSGATAVVHIYKRGG